MVGVRKLNYGLYSILVGFRNGKRKPPNYYRIGLVRSGVIDMKSIKEIDDSWSLFGTGYEYSQIIDLLHSESFLLILNDIRNHAIIDSVMME